MKDEVTHFDFRLHHVSINVSDLEKSTKFYHHLGFKDFFSYSDSDGGLQIVHLIIENFILELFWHSSESHARQELGILTHQRFLGIHHFSLQTEDIDKAFSKLKPHVVDFDSIQMGRTRIKFFFIADPDGNRIEIVEDERDKPH